MIPIKEIKLICNQTDNENFLNSQSHYLIDRVCIVISLRTKNNLVTMEKTTEKVKRIFFLIPYN